MIIRIEQADPRVRITVHLIVFGRIILLQVGKQDVIVLKAVHDIAQSVIGEIVDPAQQLLNIHVYADFHARMICRRILAQARQGNGGGKLPRSGRRIDRFGDHFQRHRQPEKDHGHQRGNTSLHRLLPPVLFLTMRCTFLFFSSGQSTLYLILNYSRVFISTKKLTAPLTLWHESLESATTN